MIAHGAEDVTTNYINCIITYIKVQRLRWAGHIQRASKDYLPKKNPIRERWVGTDDQEDWGSDD